MCATYHTTADARNQFELLAEIGRLHVQIATLVELNERKRRALDFLESQQMVATPGLLWVEGEESLEEKANGAVAMAAMKEEGRRRS